MNDIAMKWELSKGRVRLLRLRQVDSQAEWPQVVILNLTARQFLQFEKDAVAFAKKHDLYPRQPVTRMSGGVKLAADQESREAVRDTAGWTVVIYHGKTSRGFYVACAQGDC